MYPNICPIRFTYQGKTVNGTDASRASSGVTLLSASEPTPLTRGCSTRTLRYRHACSGIEWQVREESYPAYGAVSWQADIIAAQDTDILSDVGYDLLLAGQGGHVLGNYGDAVGQYALYDLDLTAEDACFESMDGRPTHGGFPYFRVETNTQKAFAVLSWQGTWNARFTQTEEGVRMTAGQAGVHTRLKAGEVFRLPLLLLLPYDRDPINTWRRFFVDTQMAYVKGAPVSPMVGIFNGQCGGLNQENVTRAYETYLREGIRPDFWWFDAGWGTDGTGPHNPRDEWFHGVNFECDYSRFPDGMESFGRRLNQDGTELMLWFEPECVRTPPDMEAGFYAYHPDFDPAWFLGTYQYGWCGITLTARLVDLGNPAALAWLENKIFTCMDEAHATIYRQDFNIPPVTVFRAADTEDRRGMAENRYCRGYLTLLDDIAARYPGILMDSCASGGGRLDLETMRRMFPLHYSDHQDVYPADCETRIFMTRVVSRWFPYTKNFAGSSALTDRYARRAALAPLISPGFTFDELERADFATLRLLIDEWGAVNTAFPGDLYEIETPDRSAETVKAYQYMTREGDFGFAAVLFPASCPLTVYTLRLCGLDSDNLYTVTDLNEADTPLLTATGSALTEAGMDLTVTPRDSRLLVIRRG